MEIKKNDATLNRPEGERVLDAPYVMIDLGSYVDQLHREESYAKNGKNGITVFKSEGLTEVLTSMEEGEEIIENEVEGFVTIQVLKGKAVLRTSQGELTMEKNQLVTIHPHVVHSFRALSDVDLLLYTVPEKS
jgi:quercetin dioxygenase-like cupin family protein